MTEYFYILIFSFVMFVGFSVYFWHYYKKKKKNDDSYKIPIKDVLAFVFLVLLSGSCFVYSLLDLPNVLADKTKHYKGECEFVIYELTNKGGHSNANFGKHSIMFPENYEGIKEGNYYCEVEYYPRTELGKSLKIFKSKGGKLINEK